MRRSLLTPLFVLAISIAAQADEPAKIKVLIIDGQHNHAWRDTTAFLKETLESTGRFAVEVSSNLKPNDKPGRVPTIPFPPDLSHYQVAISNYNGQPWPAEFRKEFAERVDAGKLGFVLFHSANNCFADWPEFNRMVGMAWRGAGAGDRLYFDSTDKLVRIPKGQGGGTGETSHPFAIVIRDPEHPITHGLPREWMHAKDQLMHNLRGPAEEVRILATAYSPKTEFHEPTLWTVTYGQGRIVQTPMGHDVFAMRCAGFVTTVRRGVEWAATGKVTQHVPEEFPAADKPLQIAEPKK